MKNVGNCRSCDAPIVWMISKNGKNIPADRDSVSDDELLDTPEDEKIRFIYKKHICHFETCPDAKGFRQ